MATGEQQGRAVLMTALLGATVALATSAAAWEDSPAIESAHPIEAASPGLVEATTSSRPSSAGTPTTAASTTTSAQAAAAPAGAAPTATTTVSAPAPPPAADQPAPAPAPQSAPQHPEPAPAPTSPPPPPPPPEPAPEPQPQPAPEPAPAPNADAARSWQLLNELRRAEGVSALAAVADATAKAQSLAERMAAERRLSHSASMWDGLDGHWTTVAENVGVGGSADEIHELLAAHSSHRRNMLGPSFTAGGVGAAWGGDGRLYLAQVFVG